MNEEEDQRIDTTGPSVAAIRGDVEAAACDDTPPSAPDPFLEDAMRLAGG